MGLFLPRLHVAATSGHPVSLRSRPRVGAGGSKGASIFIVITVAAVVGPSSCSPHRCPPSLAPEFTASHPYRAFPSRIFFRPPLRPGSLLGRHWAEWAQALPSGALGHWTWPGSCRDAPAGMEVGWVVTEAECGELSGLGVLWGACLLGVLLAGTCPPPAGPTGVTGTGLRCLAHPGWGHSPAHRRRPWRRQLPSSALPHGLLAGGPGEGHSASTAPARPPPWVGRREAWAKGLGDRGVQRWRLAGLA